MDFTELIDLASERLGGAVLFANDEFFAPKENLLKARCPFSSKASTPIWANGWTAGSRAAGARPDSIGASSAWDLPGIIRGVVVDTAHFKGNYPEQCSLEACAVDGLPTTEQLIERFANNGLRFCRKSNLNGDSQNPFAITSDERWTHLRFKIYPGRRRGASARVRRGRAEWNRLRQIGGEIDLAAVENGGLVLSCSDMFFGHRHNLIMPGRAANMSDGWETKRRRGPGHDWTIIKLGTPGHIRRLEVDTSWFKGNFPESCSLESCHAAGRAARNVAGSGVRLEAGFAAHKTAGPHAPFL